ncbi:MAG: FtsX-like permease family protein, partial [Acidimicrobiia bacterium]
YDRLNFADVTVVGTGPELAGEIASIDGVDQVEVRYRAEVPFRVDDQVFIGRLLGYPPERQPDINRIDIERGNYLDPNDPKKVVIAEFMVDQLGLDVGDSFEVLAGLQFEEVTVAGVAVSAEYLWPARSRQEIFTLPGTFGVAFVPESLIESLPRPLVSTELLVTYEPGVDVEAADAQVAEVVRRSGGGDLIAQEDQPSNAALQLDVEGFRELSFAFPALFMTAAGLAAFVLLTRLVISQRAQIGVLRASGMGRRMILRHYLSYGTRLGIVAGVAGTLLGVALGAGTTAAYTAELGIPDTVRSFHPVTPVIALAFALVTGVFGAYVPARTAFRISPAEAMRGTVPTTTSRRSIFEMVLPPLRRLPVRWLMALRGVGRVKRRSVSTSLGVVLSLTLVMASWGMIETMQAAIVRHFGAVATEDADVILTVPATDQALAEVEGVAGVRRVEAVPTVQTTVVFGSQSYTTSLAAYPSDSTVHGFPDGLPADGVLAGRSLADRIGVEVGDVVTIRLPNLDAEFTAKLVGFLDEPMGTFLYADRRFVEAQLDRPERLLAPGVTLVKVRFEDGANRQAVLADLRDLDVVAGAVDARSLEQLINDFLGFFYVFVGVMLVFGGAMAFALMFNTISVNVAERSGEFATMRANGLSHRRIGGVIAVENLLVTALGLPPGVVAGYLTGVYFMGLFSSDMFSLDFQMSPLSIAIACVAMLATAGLSLVPALRTVRRLDVGTVVRERAV